MRRSCKARVIQVVDAYCETIKISDEVPLQSALISIEEYLMLAHTSSPRTLCLTVVKLGYKILMEGNGSLALRLRG